MGGKGWFGRRNAWQGVKMACWGQVGTRLGGAGDMAGGRSRLGVVDVVVEVLWGRKHERGDVAMVATSPESVRGQMG